MFCGYELRAQLERKVLLCFDGSRCGAGLSEECQTTAYALTAGVSPLVASGPDCQSSAPRAVGSGGAAARGVEIPFPLRDI